MSEKNITLRVLGDFTIPTNQFGEAVEHAYHWEVYVDKKYYGTFSGVSSPGSEGIYLDIEPRVEHRVDLIPYHGYKPGWGRAFGFSSGTHGANSLLNKARLREVLSDPDYAHAIFKRGFLEPGRNFRRAQYSDCINLENVIPEDGIFNLNSLPGGTVVEVTNFQYGMYHRCKKIFARDDVRVMSF